MVHEGRRVTLAEVATAAGVSPMTASYSYNQPERVADSTRERVFAAAQELGFRGPDPSGRHLRRGAMRSLGLVLGESLNYVFEDPQGTRFVAGIARECASAGYGLTLVPVAAGEGGVDRIATAAVDAFVVWTTTADDPVLDAVRATHRRAIIHGGPSGEGFALVGIDNRSAATTLAADVWATSDHPAILAFPLDRDREAGVHFGLDPEEVPYPVTRDRLAGYRAAALALGIDWETVPIAVCPRNSALDAEAAIAELLSRGRTVDGICAMSDQQALGAWAALEERGVRVPEDVTIGGFDDSEEGAVKGLTSVHQSLYDQGARSARLALHGDPNNHEPDDWRLVKRSSTERVRTSDREKR
jgi:DNA-binding LacI/PurR family transcriptional regulator